MATTTPTCTSTHRSSTTSGKALKWGEKQLYVGIEYDYWKNKYGIKDGGFVSDNFVGSTDQNTASLLVKAHF